MTTLVRSVRIPAYLQRHLGLLRGGQLSLLARAAALSLPSPPSEPMRRLLARAAPHVSPTADTLHVLWAEWTHAARQLARDSEEEASVQEAERWLRELPPVLALALLYHLQASDPHSTAAETSGEETA